MYQSVTAVSSHIVRCCTKRTGYLRCGNWSLEGCKEKHKAQKRDYTFHVSLWEMKFSFKKQPKGISFFLLQKQVVILTKQKKLLQACFVPTFLP